MVMRYHGGGVGHLGMRFDLATYEGPGPAGDAEDLQDLPAPEPQAADSEAADSDSSKSDMEDFIHEQREVTEEEDEDEDEEEEETAVKDKQEPDRDEGDEDIVVINEDDPCLYGFDEA
jgi:hypothetical protein